MTGSHNVFWFFHCTSYSEDAVCSQCGKGHLSQMLKKDVTHEKHLYSESSGPFLNTVIPY